MRRGLSTLPQSVQMWTLQIRQCSCQQRGAGMLAMMSSNAIVQETKERGLLELSASKARRST